MVTSAQPPGRPGDYFFPADLSAVAWPLCQYPRRLQDLAVRLGAAEGLPDPSGRWPRWRAHRLVVPSATSQQGGAAAGEKQGGGPRDHLPGRGAG